MPVESPTHARDIDFSLPFFPPRLTPLAHTPSWPRLDARQQLRYSQLYALYLNEQTAFFEETLASTVLPAFYQKPERIGDDLAADLRRFEAEERVHSRWFRSLNRRVDPERFTLETGHYVFITMSGRVRAVTLWLAGRPFDFPAWIWLMLLQEERSISRSKECLDEGSRIEPAFLDLHRRHMADEVDHVRWDLELVERVWLPLPMWRRHVHARMFGWMMTEFFTAPKRAARVVLATLIDEFPTLASQARRIHLELDALAHCPVYHASMYSRTATPRCFELFDKLPEFRGIGRHLLAYQRP